MGLFEKLFGKKKNGNMKDTHEQKQNADEAAKATQESEEHEPAEAKQELSSEDIIQVMLANAEASLNAGMPERAFETYKQIAELNADTTAQYNLASLYAQGKGTVRNFLQASYWFRQVALSGDEQAEKLCAQTTRSYIEEDLLSKEPKEIWQGMLDYAALLYPREDGAAIASKNLCDMGGLHFNKKEYTGAAKLFRAAAEYGNNETAQNFLAVLYNAGAGLEKNDIAALYWFDRAVDNGVEKSRVDRDGIFNAYHTNLSPKDFYEQMEILIANCTNGSAEIPQDVEKASYWRNKLEETLKADKAEREKAEREKAEKEKAEREKAEKEKAEREKAAREEAEREKVEREKAAREKAEKEKTAREEAAAEEGKEEPEKPKFTIEERMENFVDFSLKSLADSADQWIKEKPSRVIFDMPGRDLTCHLISRWISGSGWVLCPAVTEKGSNEFHQHLYEPIPDLEKFLEMLRSGELTERVIKSLSDLADSMD